MFVNFHYFPICLDSPYNIEPLILKNQTLHSSNCNLWYIVWQELPAYLHDQFSEKYNKNQFSWPKYNTIHKKFHHDKWTIISHFEFWCYLQSTTNTDLAEFKRKFKILNQNTVVSFGLPIILRQHLLLTLHGLLSLLCIDFKTISTFLGEKRHKFYLNNQGKDTEESNQS